MSFSKVFISLIVLMMCFAPIGAGEHDDLTAILKGHVKGDQVDYQGLVAKKPALKAYLEKLEKISLKGMSKDREMAVWINAYNACTLMLIIENYPLKSIMDIAQSKRWKWKNWTIAGEKLSLDEIEHVKLRPMGDPRIHFAINCASFSCPPLLDVAIEPKQLEEQLEKMTKAFFKDEARGLSVKTTTTFFGASKTRVYISKLFSWFAQDFIETDGSILAYVKKYADKEHVKVLADLSDDGDLYYLDYDWSLNGK